MEGSLLTSRLTMPRRLAWVSGALEPRFRRATIESGLGKSKVGREAKNLFGITYHNCKHVAGRYGAYAKYASYRDNVKCYAHIQGRYLGNINGRYAADPGYVDKLKTMK